MCCCYRSPLPLLLPLLCFFCINRSGFIGIKIIIWYQFTIRFFVLFRYVVNSHTPTNVRNWTQMAKQIIWSLRTWQTKRNNKSHRLNCFYFYFLRFFLQFFYWVIFWVGNETNPLKLNCELFYFCVSSVRRFLLCSFRNCALEK